MKNSWTAAQTQTFRNPKIGKISWKGPCLRHKWEPGFRNRGDLVCGQGAQVSWKGNLVSRIGDPVSERGAPFFYFARKSLKKILLVLFESTSSEALKENPSVSSLKSKAKKKHFRIEIKHSYDMVSLIICPRFDIRCRKISKILFNCPFNYYENNI